MSGPKSTARLPFTADDLMRAGSHPEGRVSLLLYHREGATVVPLRAGQPVTVGRAPPSNVTIGDASLSREHARFSFDGDQVMVEDLGSTNGTRVNGERVTRSALAPTDEVILGTVIASVHVLAGAERRQLGVGGHDAFCALLETELARAKYFTRSLVVVMVQAPRQKDAHLRHWFPHVQALLRPVDRVFLYGPDTVEILLPEATREQAFELAKTLVARREGAPALVCGIADFPDAAGSAEELIEVSRSALLRARSDAPVQLADSERARTWLPPEGVSTQPVIQSTAMRAVVQTAQRVARGVIPVLVNGETGTGKEVLARVIHESGPRHSRPMICINCAAIPAQLVESTLFGHEKGAFTGATQQQKGVFESAEGGTVLLDEVGELSLVVQAALLRVLETKRITRVGSMKEIDVDVRVLAATHRDLEAMTEDGRFRTDLLYRLNAITLRLPPLRERRDDVPPLADRFLRMANEANGGDVRGIHPLAMEMLHGYSWPGNVRELKNAIERAVVICEGEVVTIDELPEKIRAAAPSRRAPSEEPPADVKPTGPPVRGTVPPGPPALAFEGDFKARMDRLEAEVILDALRQSDWNQTEAAKRLQMPLRTLVYKIKQHGIKKLGFAKSDPPTES